MTGIETWISDLEELIDAVQLIEIKSADDRASVDTETAIHLRSDLILHAPQWEKHLEATLKMSILFGPNPSIWLVDRLVKLKKVACGGERTVRSNVRSLSPPKGHNSHSQLVVIENRQFPQAELAAAIRHSRHRTNHVRPNYTNYTSVVPANKHHPDGPDRNRFCLQHLESHSIAEVAQGVSQAQM